MRILAGLVSAGVLVWLSAGSASAQVSGYGVGPFSSWWELAERPLAGQVKRIEILREMPASNGKPAALNPLSIVAFIAAGDGRVEKRIGPEDRPHAVVTLDAKGRPISVLSRFTRGGDKTNAWRWVKSLELAARDEQGFLQSIRIIEGDKADEMLVRFTAQDEPAGARSLSGEYAADPEKPDKRFAIKLIYDPQGRVASIQSGWVGNPRVKNVRLTRNAQGDIVSRKQTETGGDEYEYEYDSTGNWTRMTRFSVSSAKREARETYVRKIEYGAPQQIKVAGATTRPAGKPQPARKPPPEAIDIDEKRVVGSFTRVSGEKGSGFHATLTLTISDDHTMVITNLSDFRGQINTNKALGTWAVEGKTLLLKVETSLDDAPVPPEMSAWKLAMLPGGDLIPLDGASDVFKRSP